VNGLLNETVVRVVLMVKVRSPGRTALPAAGPITDPARRTSRERPLKPIGYRPLPLSKIAQVCRQNGPQLVVNGTTLKRLTSE
jgi:hypothetical protein